MCNQISPLQPQFTFTTSVHLIRQKIATRVLSTWYPVDITLLLKFNQERPPVIQVNKPKSIGL